MGRGGPLIIFGITIVVALIGAVLVFAWLRQGTPPPQETVVKNVEPVLVAKQDLMRGTCLNESHVEVKSLESEGLPAGRFSRPSDIKGRVLLDVVKAQDTILETHLSPAGTLCGVAAVLDPTKRAMAVRVDDVVGVAGFIKPGDHVDVYVTVPPALNVKDTVTKLVIQNSQVLATGSEMERVGEEGQGKPVTVVTLEVAPDEAERLAMASNQGRLRLALRSPLNPEQVLTEGETSKTLLEAYRPKRKVVNTKPPRTVELIKGSSSTTHKFK